VTDPEPLRTSPERSLQQAVSSFPDDDYTSLTAPVLAELTREHGVDFATALWYDRVRSAEPHRAFVDAWRRAYRLVGCVNDERH
jgi:hypothetical protein